MSITRLLALVSLVAWSAGAVAQCPLQWSAANEDIVDTVLLPDGDLVAVGYFTTIGGMPANRVARLHGTSWAPLGTGLDAPASHVARLPNGDLLVAGAFTTAGGVPSPGLARWDGAAWHAHPGAPLGDVAKMVAMPNGDVIVARGVSPSPTTGFVEISRFDGVAWQVIGTSYGSTGLSPNASVRDLEVLADGTLVAVGDWAGMNPVGSAGPFQRELVTWNGASWDYLYGAPYPEDLLQTKNGDLYLATSTSFSSGVLRRSGGAWTAIGGFGEVLALAELPNGDVVAAGYQSGQPWQMGCRRWNGASWSDLGFWTPGAQGSIGFLFVHPASGRLFASGLFSSAGGIPAAGRAWLTTPCLATAVSTPTSCVGPAGAMTTFASELAWTGGSLRTTTTGFAPTAVAVIVLGAAPTSLPLTGLLPTLSPGCDLLVAPDVLLAEFPLAGSLDFAIAVPNVPALAGVVIHQQVGQLDLGPSGIVSASVANRLTSTVGTF